jgi:4-amino-4-deoxy-L-arabinose transferase-like glycosyltransferase
MILSVVEFIRKNLKFVLWVTAGALCLRLLMVYKLDLVAGDSLVYDDIAKNLLNHGTFALTTMEGIRPTLVRLPGYPFFLAFIFAIFGQDNFRAVTLVQAIIDLGTCVLVCDIARRTISERAARMAFLIAALCPFIATYTATPLTEVPSIFFLTLSLQQAVIAFDELRYRNWIYCGLALGAAILLRPDSGLMLGSIGLIVLFRLYRYPAERKKLFAGGLLMTAVALVPLAPWTIRNWRVMHVFQPLVTVEATDPGEFVAWGWGYWARTWVADYANVEDICFHVDGEPVDINVVPARAFDSPQERTYVAQLFAEYNQTAITTPELDQKFLVLAQQKIRRHRFRYYVGLPVLRLLDMWFRPRTAVLPFDVHWWTLRDDPWNTTGAILLGLCNLLLVGAAIVGIFRGKPLRYMALLLVILAVRSLFLMITGAAEDRYTLECFPCIYLLASRWLVTWRLFASTKSRSYIESGGSGSLLLG